MDRTSDSFIFSVMSPGRTIADNIEDGHDADLIAAAPDLLAELKDCADQLALLVKNPQSNAFVQSAYAVIAKAEGKSLLTKGENGG